MELKQFKIVVLPLRSKLLNYVRKLGQDSVEPEDVVQEVMLKLWEMRFKLDDYNSVEALAMRIAHNLCIDLWRKSRPDLLHVDQLSVKDEWVTPEKLLERKDEYQLIAEIIETLPSVQRMIIRMKDMEEYETDEIAEITGCNQEAIRSNLSRARKKVRDTFMKMQISKLSNK